MVSCPNVIAPFMTSLPVTHGLLGLRWWPVPGAVFCYLFGVRHHLQSRVEACLLLFLREIRCKCVMSEAVMRCLGFIGGGIGRQELAVESWRRITRHSVR